MKMMTIIAALLVSTSTLAGNPPPKPDPAPTANSNATALAGAEANAVALGLGVGIAGVKNDVTNTNVGINGQHQGQSLDNDIKNSNSNVGVNTNVNDLSNRNSNANVNGQHQGQGQEQGQAQRQGQEQNASSDQAQSQSANNEGNEQSTTINQTYKQVRNAPSIAVASVYPTAGCQGGVSLGGSNVNGSGGFAFSLTKKECEAVALAQNFSAIGMPDTTCNILKTTKAFVRAVKRFKKLYNADLVVDCTPAPKATAYSGEPAQPEAPDMAEYVRRDELAERDRRMIETMSRK